MKVYLKLKNRRRYCIPVPLPFFLIRIGLSDFTKRQILKHTDEKIKRYIEPLDFRAIARSLEGIKGYKGLKLVEVFDKEGTEVTIII